MLRGYNESPTLTPAGLAAQCVSALGADRDLTFAPQDHGSPILDQVCQWTRKEYEFVKFMTPVLLAVCSPKLVFVNSEEFPWLGTIGSKHKPDGFFAPI